MTNPESPFFATLEMQTYAETTWRHARQNPGFLKPEEENTFLEKVRKCMRLQFVFTFGENYKENPYARQVMNASYGTLYLEHTLEEIGSPQRSVRINVDRLGLLWGGNWFLNVVLTSDGDRERLLNGYIAREDQKVDITSFYQR